MSKAPETVGTVEAALANAARLLETAPALAAEQGREILKAVPDHPKTLLLLGAALRATGSTLPSAGRSAQPAGGRV